MDQSKSITQQALEQLLTQETEQAAPAPERKISMPAWATLIGGNLADVGSTVHALNNGAREGNPLYGEHPSAGRIVGTKLVQTALEALLMKALEKTGHTKAANNIGYGLGIGTGAVAVSNMTKGNKSK